MGSRSVVDIALTTKDSLSSSAIRVVEERLRFWIMNEKERIIDTEGHATTTGSVGMEVNETARRLEGRSPCQVEDVKRELLLEHEQVCVVWFLVLVLYLLYYYAILTLHTSFILR